MITAIFSHNILGYSDTAQLQRRSTDAVKELVLRCCVYWPNRLGWRQKVIQPPSMFMLISWWCPLGHDKRHLPAIQIFIAVPLIPILNHLSSRWTVPLTLNFRLHILVRLDRIGRAWARPLKKLMGAVSVETGRARSEPFSKKLKKFSIVEKPAETKDYYSAS